MEDVTKAEIALQGTENDAINRYGFDFLNP
jgi:hypothetical protein